MPLYLIICAHQWFLFLTFLFLYHKQEYVFTCLYPKLSFNNLLLVFTPACLSMELSIYSYSFTYLFTFLSVYDSINLTIHSITYQSHILPIHSFTSLYKSIHPDINLLLSIYYLSIHSYHYTVIKSPEGASLTGEAGEKKNLPYLSSGRGKERHYR